MRIILIAIFMMTGTATCFGAPVQDDPFGTTLNESRLIDPVTNFQRSGIYSSRQNVQFARFQKVDPAKKATIREDATILNHMISKALPLKNSRTALGVNFAQSFGKNEIVYGDYGLTFTYHVPVQLVEGEKAPSSDKKETKSPWDQAKEELDNVTVITTSGFGGATTARLSGLRLPNNIKYDQEYVDRITGHVRSALSNAGNFRDLSENDSVTVLVYGYGDKPGTRAVLGWRVKLKDVADDSAMKFIEETSYIENASDGTTTYLPGMSGGGRGISGSGGGVR